MWEQENLDIDNLQMRNSYLIRGGQQHKFKKMKWNKLHLVLKLLTVLSKNINEMRFPCVFLHNTSKYNNMIPN